MRMKDRLLLVLTKAQKELTLPPLLGAFLNPLLMQIHSIEDEKILETIKQIRAALDYIENGDMDHENTEQ
jgi:hypothetical protein